MINTEHAWAAGFLDGEGCFAAYKGDGSVRLQLQADQNDPEVLVRLFYALGRVGKVYGPYRRPGTLASGAPANPRWCWRVWRPTEIRDTVSLLWPYLSQVKRDQYLEAETRYRSENPDFVGARV